MGDDGQPIYEGVTRAFAMGKAWAAAALMGLPQVYDHAAVVSGDVLSSPNGLCAKMAGDHHDRLE